MEFKVNIGDPKSKRSVQKVVSGKEAEFFLKKTVGEKISGDAIGFAGYEFEITGGSDYCGFPMRKDVRGTARKKILIVGGVGLRKNAPGRKVRKTVAGSTIYSRTAQINLKVLKQGAAPLIEEKKEEGKAEEKKAEGEAKAAEAKEAKAEAKEEKKAEEKAEAKKETKEEKPEVKEHKEAKPKKEPKKE
ncbi:30S ribosomal protein S6e [Candidatus Woesearchaeota archaeon]|nr:30S ribosomal protein S6e [Candidatus Woesearchaeota archaeon]